MLLFSCFSFCASNVPKQPVSHISMTHRAINHSSRHNRDARRNADDSWLSSARKFFAYDLHVTARDVRAIARCLEKQSKRNWLFSSLDNACRRKSKMVRDWVSEHNVQVNREGTGVRIFPFLLPKQSRLSQSN